ncbi:hypothetical protein PI125_g16692 [Phytophthora idaei]|nr:hypothetical protein PI125_g16692 [Phytophthora idaei]
MTKRPSSLTPQMAMQGLAALCRLDAERQAKRARVVLLPSDSSDEEVEDGNSIYDTILQEGPDNIQTLTNFTPEQFEQLWSQVQNHVAMTWNKGRKTTTKPMDVFFMLLAVLKNAGHWDVLAGVFGFKGAAFQKMMTKFADLVAPFLYKRYVTSNLEKFPMVRLITEDKTFHYHPYALYATVSTFQQTNIPTGRAKTRDLYQNAKFQLFGYKNQVSVLPNGLAVDCTGHAPGNEADADIFRQNAEFHYKALGKAEREMDIADDGELVATYPDSWAVLADKNFQSLSEDLRVVTPFRKSTEQRLTPDQVETNRSLAHDRRIANKFLGRLTSLWAICSDKYRWDESQYDPYWQVCVALTNVHVNSEPLNDDDGDNFKQYLQELVETGVERREKRHESQKKYREKRQNKVNEEVSSILVTSRASTYHGSTRRRLEIRPSSDV